jgi:hypothetical protein
MTAELTNQAPETRIEWYARTEVDSFLEAAARQRAELEAQITQAQTRAERARTAAGLHRVMATMVLDTQRELAAVRAEAEAKARVIVQGTASSATNGHRIHDSTPPTIDLVAAAGSSNGVGVSLPPPAYLSNGKEADGQEGDAEFLAFLRDGLADPGPLGPPST